MPPLHRRVRARNSEAKRNPRVLGSSQAAPIEIEVAGPDDLEALYRIEKECFAPEAFSKELVASLLRDPDSTSLLAKLGDTVVGFIIAVTYEVGSDGVSHILTVNVAPGARRRGVGRQLIGALESRVAEKGAVACWLEVAPENVAARELYREVGYAEVGRVKNYYRSGGDCFIMKKQFR
jgi:ribosomal-protein-alanine N-acetyltransferase